jgi:two-component system phosphate regulon sensor histidine kinase PhoR
VLVVLDITEIRRLERVRRDFVSNVSHELRTPLTAIQGFAETLLRGALEEPENSRRFVEIIGPCVAPLARLTRTCRKLSRIEVEARARAPRSRSERGGAMRRDRARS